MVVRTHSMYYSKSPIFTILLLNHSAEFGTGPKPENRTDILVSPPKKASGIRT